MPAHSAKKQPIVPASNCLTPTPAVPGAKTWASPIRKFRPPMHLTGYAIPIPPPPIADTPCPHKNKTRRQAVRRVSSPSFLAAAPPHQRRRVPQPIAAQPAPSPPAPPPRPSSTPRLPSPESAGGAYKAAGCQNPAPPPSPSHPGRPSTQTPPAAPDKA